MCILNNILWSHSGSYKEQKELCLDCRSQTAQRILQQCQKEHKARLRFVVYSDADCREIVPVHWPIKLSRMPPYVRFTVKAEHLNTCGDPTACSFPHHYLEARILNLWRENSVVTSTRPSLVRIPDSPSFNTMHITSYIMYLHSCRHGSWPS